MTQLKNNMLKKGKKGFTLTELAIVIAVIAILIAVLVPTFTSVITSARETTAAEEATNAITAYTLENASKGDTVDNGTVIRVESGNYVYYFTVNGGTAELDETITSDPTGGYTKYNWENSEYASTYQDKVIFYFANTSATEATSTDLAAIIAACEDESITLVTNDYITITTTSVDNNVTTTTVAYYKVSVDTSTTATVDSDATATTVSSMNVHYLSVYTNVAVYTVA